AVLSGYIGVSETVEPSDAVWSIWQRHSAPRRARRRFGPRLQAIHRLQHRSRVARLSFDFSGRASFHRRRAGLRQSFFADLARGQTPDAGAWHSRVGPALA